jgi:pantoate--beta-alanine ligase
MLNKPMRILTTIAEFRKARADSPGPLGFAPTMGYLHDGHMELVRQARRANRTVAASIFVNPTQFGPSEDFAAYPRDFERDRAMLEKEGCDLLFYPAVEEMYPQPAADVYVVPERIAAVLEGASRPGHFRGVATVVAKLFNIVQPQRAYFGQKDGQQVAVIKRMVRDLNFPVEIVVVPTVRESDGLAMSSRNVYLDSSQRAAAPVLYRALTRAREMFEDGARDAEALRKEMLAVLAKEPLAEVVYVSIADAETLEEVQARIERPAMASLAVRVGLTRLIDNITLAPPGR